MGRVKQEQKEETDTLRIADNFVRFVNQLNLSPSVPLNVVAHSHGGNVVKLASYALPRKIDFLVTLGTPQNWDLPEINPFAFHNYCEVSSVEDYTQFSGAGVAQLYNFGEDQYEVGYWVDQEAQDLYNGLYAEAAYDAEQIALYEADASYWRFSTKIAAYANNIMLDGQAHSDLHSAPVWNGFKHDCGLPN